MDVGKCQEIINDVYENRRGAIYCKYLPYSWKQQLRGEMRKVKIKWPYSTGKFEVKGSYNHPYKEKSKVLCCKCKKFIKMDGITKPE